MKPVDQDRFGPGVGNCFSAAVASILELPLAEVPFFMTDPDTWWNTFRWWLAERGFTADYYPSREWCEENAREYRDPPSGYSLLSGLSPRYANTYHTVVALDGVIAHDPHPDRTGLLSTLDYITISPIGAS